MFNLPFGICFHAFFSSVGGFAQAALNDAIVCYQFLFNTFTVLCLAHLLRQSIIHRNIQLAHIKHFGQALISVCLSLFRLSASPCAIRKEVALST